ncbi:hypothetical protein [Bifidobacterium callimiconis]|uniref:Uncharacterized protein n=1 Tax=Bifidobacterium callimiconis TaxID=2306973 RepID=A0A430FIL3_9BIFI|nr:hypothetical protein [Bifidobacterium callimiconis]RSX52640.1 hypothetical protein D2E23_0368 [Bifidobacterium callimiconis]
MIDPQAPSLPTDPPAGVSLDDAHVKYSPQAVKMTAGAGRTVTALLFPDHKGTAAPRRVGLWAWVEPAALPSRTAGDNATTTQIMIGRGNGGGNGTTVMGGTIYTGLHAGWNLCLYDDMAWQTGLTVQWRSESGGSVWIDSLLIDPPTPRSVIVFTHDISPSLVDTDMIDMYQSRGLTFTWDRANDSTWTAENVAHLLAAGLTDNGVYSGHDEDIDYTSGDWTPVIQRMHAARDIPTMPRASYVASTNNRLGAAYTRQLAADGWPLIRGTYGGGPTLAIDPTHREIPTVGYENVADSLETWADLGAIIVVTEHKIVADGQGSDTTQIERSKWTALLDRVKTLVDAGRLECLTMRQLAQRHVPDALHAWDQQAN